MPSLANRGCFSQYQQILYCMINTKSKHYFYTTYVNTSYDVLETLYEFFNFRKYIRKLQIIPEIIVFCTSKFDFAMQLCDITFTRLY